MEDTWARKVWRYLDLWVSEDRRSWDEVSAWSRCVQAEAGQPHNGKTVKWTLTQVARGDPPKLRGCPRGGVAALPPPPKNIATLSCRPRVETVTASPLSTSPSSRKSSWTKTKVSADHRFLEQVLGPEGAKGVGSGCLPPLPP